MKNTLLFIIVCLSIACGGSRKASSARNHVNNKKQVVISSKNKKIEAILDYAKTFKGTRYRYAGTTKKGMDCSGLVYVSFLKEGIELPRTSRSMATKGTKVSLSKAENGDLVFFKTNKRKNTISHVGIIVDNSNPIQFIHSSTSKGVIISTLEETYWNRAFAQIRRMH